VIAHIVLFQPRGDLSPAERAGLLEALAAAASRIPAVRRFRVGRRIMHGVPGYEQVTQPPFEFAAIAEFDDREALKAYLAHPAHEAIGAHFYGAAAAALAYDFEMVDAADAASLLET
jgi:hypothetical protein